MCKERGTHFGPPCRLVCVTFSWFKGPKPESPSLLLSNLVDSLLNALNASIVSCRRVLIIAIDVEIGSIRPNVVAKLAVCEFWHPRSAISS